MQGPALDGSGVYVQLAAGQYDWTNSVTYAKNGTQMLQAGYEIRDTNGNIINATADTLGRNDVVVAYDPNYPMPTSAASPKHQIYTVHDSNGNPQNYLVDFEPVQFTSSACGQDILPGSLIAQETCNETTVPILELSQLTLSDQKKYVFTYNANSPGELASITLPTGGTINYTYGDFYQLSYTTVKGQPNNVVGGRAVKTRTVTEGGRTYPWTYNLGLYSNAVTDPDGNVATHTFSQIAVGANNTSYSSTGHYETNVAYADSKGNLLRNVQTDYLAEYDPVEQIAGSVQPIRTTTTLDNGMVSKTEKDYETFSFDCNICTGPGIATRLNPTEVREFDYGAGSPGPLVRRTDYTYLHNVNPAYVPLNIVDKPQSVTVYDGSGNMVSQTTYEYDNYSHSNQSMQASGAIQHDAGFGTSYQTRGNVTATSHWLNTNGASLTATNQYDDAGNVLSTKDPIGNLTSYSYSDAWANGSCITSSTKAMAYPTSVTNAKGQTSTSLYNSCTGTIASSKDANNNTSSVTYDLFNRPTSVHFPDGGAKTFCYSDDPSGSCASSQTSMVSSTALTSGLNVMSTTVFDGLGQTQTTELNAGPDGIINSDSIINDRGQTVSTSNPYFAKTEATYGATSFTYDVLGRKLVQTNPDNSTVKLSYSGNVTTTTDENGNQWKRAYDALGRLTKVLEPDPTSGVASLETDYTYDILGNLLTVNQVGSATAGEVPRTRSFKYDSLSRLLTAQNSETGTICYGQWSGSNCVNGYDANGNLLFKTDARNVTTAYTYDTLNRLVAKSYSGSDATSTAIAAQTQPVNFVYDTSPSGSVANGVGRLVSESTGPASAPTTAKAILQYDAMGRVLRETQCETAAVCAGTPYSFQYLYDLAGDVTWSNNGLSSMGIGVTYSYDEAARLQSVSSSWEDSTHPSLLFGPPVVGPQYGPAGLTSAWLGSPSSSQPPTYMQTRAYDNRLRTISEATSTPTAASTSVGSITVSGAEQSTTSNTPGSATITITGTEGSHQVCTTGPSKMGSPPVQKCNDIADTGTLVATVNNFPASASYQIFSTDASVANSLAAALSVNGSPVTAVAGGAAGNVVTLTSIAMGPSSNYPLQITNGVDFTGTDSGSTLTGGATGPTVSDSGKIVVNVDGVTAKATWTAISTPESVASDLKAALSANGVGVITATQSGSTITLAGAQGVTGTAITYTVTDDWGSTPSFAVNPIGMLQVMPGTQLYAYSLGYQPNGNVQTTIDSVMGKWTYSYDHLDRLISGQASANGSFAPFGSALLGWTYDSFGNRKHQGLSGNTQMAVVQGSYTYTANNNRMDGYSYDAAGNLLQDGTNTYTYDAEGRVAKVNGTTQYAYDAEGQRVAKLNGSSVTNLYLLGQGGEQVTELGGQGNWLHSNVYAAGKLLATYDSAGLHYQFSDWLGSRRVQSLVPATGVAVAEETCQSLQFGDSLACTGTDATDLHFTGKQRDTESGLDYFGARYYGSSMGRFMSPDDGADAMVGVPVPFADLSNPQSLNLYSYVNNNPLTRRDYDGHASYQPCNGGTQQCFQGDYDGEKYCGFGNGTCLTWNAKTGEWGVPPLPANADGRMNPDNSILEWIVGGKVAEAGLGVVGGSLGRGATAAAEGAAGKGVQQVAKVLLKAGTKQEAKAAIDGMAEGVQRAAAKRELARATTKEAVSVSQSADGTVTITRTRPGFDGSQTFTKTIDSAGNTSSVQTAHDAAGNLVHYDPKK